MSKVKLGSFLKQYRKDVEDAMASLEKEKEKLKLLTAMIEGASKEGGIVWLAGNGGSHSLASHMATDLQLARVRAMVLGDATSITSSANDEGYENSLLFLAKKLVGAQDLVITLSTSGESTNINDLLDWCDMAEINWFPFTGKEGGPFGEYGFHIPHSHTGVIQDVQEMALHAVAYYLMEKANA